MALQVSPSTWRACMEWVVRGALGGVALKKPGFLKKAWTNQHVGRGANVWLESPDSAPFWVPKTGHPPARPDVAEIGPLLPRFGPKSGRPEVMAGWPVFLEIRIS